MVGLTAHLRDLRELVKRARTEAKTVILGVHSLGSSLVSFYAVYTFEGGRPGDTFIDGLVLLDCGDTVVSTGRLG